MDVYKAEFMKRAIELAKANVEKGNGGPFGAVVVKDGKIIAEAMNEVVSNNDPSAHAEVLAIRRACQNLQQYQLNGCEIYSSCEPCPMCLGTIYWARPDRVYFAANRKDAAASGFDDDYIYQELALPTDKREIPFYSIMRNEALEAFKEWDESGLEIKY
jgi:tRNA(Arg) A34 adenosine deaminase TadA